MLDQGFGIAKAHGPGNHLQAVHHFTTGLDPAFKFERNHAAKTGHLFFGKIVLGETGKSGVINRFDLRMCFQKRRDFFGIVAMAFHAQFQRF